MRVAAVALVSACALAVAMSLSVRDAESAPGVRFGIQDDAWLEFGPGRLGDRVAQLDRLGLDVVRVTLHWYRTERAPGRYDWRRTDRLLRALDARGLDPVVTIWGTPEWAGDGRPNSPPLHATDFSSFAQAAATRYSFVRNWTIWNEPNKVIWLNPVSPRTYVTRILNPGYQGIKAASPSAKVAGGVTAPRGGQGGMAPVDFIRGMDRAGARLDAYAHHPYPDYPGDTPFEGGCQHCKTISMSTLERLLREAGKAFPKASIWLTEYGYQSTPDPFGVTPAVQARFVSEAARRVYAAPRVEMLIHYLYRDEPDLARWQSGLETVEGLPKPALQATMLPLAQVSRKGSTTSVWGQVRPGEGRQRYVLQRRTQGRWIAIGGTRTTSARGYFRLTLPAPKGAQLRIWDPARAIASATLVVR
jgi:polysaccharide biosynthesis protein PslG